jgi:hypothetical protein
MLTSLSCSNGQNVRSDETVPVTNIQDSIEPYSLELNVEKINTHEFKLVSIIKIDSLSYMMPIANTTMSGIFKFSIVDTNQLNTNYILVEHACPVVTNFVWSNAPQKVIKGYVEYDQKLSVISTTDFVSTGFIQFVIEPRCTLEKIPFTISYMKGEMKVSID